jgi:transposase InsO family protein
LRLRIRKIAQTRVCYGYRKIRVLLNREGWKVGKKLVYRLYREEGLSLRHKPRKRRRASLHRRERFRPTAPNQVWSLDFVADQLADGRRFRALTILDVFTRESLQSERKALAGSSVFHNLQRRGCDIRHRTPTLSYSSLLFVVETEDQICGRFEAELAAIAALDRRYYANASPSAAERADYAARQVQLESTRSRFYGELGSFREYSSRQLRRCRFLARSPRPRRRRP